MILRRAALGTVAVLAAVYAGSPWLLARLLPPLLARWDIEPSRFEFGYPRWNGIRIDRFELHSAAATIEGGPADVGYSLPALLRGELDSVAIDELRVRLPQAPERARGGEYELPAFWGLVPARRVDVEHLVVSNAAPSFEAVGRVTFDPDVLSAEMRVDSELLAVPLFLRGSVDPDGRVALAASEGEGAPPLANLSGTVDRTNRAMAFDVAASLTGRPLALAAGYANATAADGVVQLQFHGSAPWPLPASADWRSIAGDGRFRVDLHGGIEGIEVSVAKAAGEFRVANESIEAHLEQGSAVELVVPDLGAATPFGANLAIDTDRDVAIEYSRDRVRVGDGAILSLQAGGKPIRLRARGAHGPASAFEVVIAEVDDSPVLLARGTLADATTTNVKVQIGLSGRLLRVAAAAIGVDAASGQVSADFDGRVRLPATLQNTSGQGRFHVDVGGRTAGRRFDTAIDGGYVLDQGIRTSVDSGAHVGLNDAGIDLTTVSNATLDIGLEPLRIALGALDCKFALPPIAVGERQIVLKDAWMSLDAATFAADEFRASATLRSHAGRDAWPLRVRVSHDLATSRGTFSATGDWRAQNGAMRDELPGFDAPYDLDAGTVALTLDGRWDVSQEPTYAARGRLAVNAAQAHYEDYPIAGLSFELPIAIDPAGLSIADSRVSIASIDVGFPVTDVSLGIAVAGDVAHVRDLGGAVLGGRFAADAFDYDLNSDVANPEVSVRDVSLAEVLALEGGDVRGTGVLDGRLPIGISGDALTITDGRVTARPPGGTLIYKGAAAASMAQKSGLAFAFKALEDFHYDTLDARVALQRDGILALGVRLQGFNPAVEAGRAIQFNLNLTESLPALLESLRAADRITDKVEQQFVR